MSDVPVDVTQAETQPTEGSSEAQTHEAEKHFEPRGAFVFVLLLLAFYAIYFIMTYFEVFVLRGN